MSRIVKMNSSCLQWNPCKTMQKQDTKTQKRNINQQLFLRRDASTSVTRCNGHAVEVKLGDWRMCHCGAPVIPTYPKPIPKRLPSSRHGELTTPGCLVHSWMTSEGSRLSFAHVLAVSWDDVSEKVVGCVQILLLNSEYIAKPWINMDKPVVWNCACNIIEGVISQNFSWLFVCLCFSFWDPSSNLVLFTCIAKVLCFISSVTCWVKKIQHGAVWLDQQVCGAVAIFSHRGR